MKDFTDNDDELKSKLDFVLNAIKIKTTAGEKYLKIHQLSDSWFLNYSTDLTQLCDILRSLGYKIYQVPSPNEKVNDYPMFEVDWRHLRWYRLLEFDASIAYYFKSDVITYDILKNEISKNYDFSLHVEHPDYELLESEIDKVYFYTYDLKDGWNHYKVGYLELTEETLKHINRDWSKGISSYLDYYRDKDTRFIDDYFDDFDEN